MNWKWIYAIFGFVVLSSVVFAMTQATVSGQVEYGRWAGLTAGNATTEGGNISGVNLNGTMLTDKWASFFGNVTGGIRLTDFTGVNDVYSWTWSATEGGEVCLTQDSGFSWASATTTTAADVDGAFLFGAAPDNATNTYLDGTCSITIDEVVGAISTTGTSLMGLSTFSNCVLQDQGSPTEGDLAFCAPINGSGTNWEGNASNYEVMVPTTATDGAVETYYFFVELN